MRGSKPEEGPARIAGDGAIVKACPGRRPANQACRLYQTFHPLKPLQKQLDSFKVGGWKSISRSVPRKVCSDHTGCILMGRAVNIQSSPACKQRVSTVAVW